MKFLMIFVLSLLASLTLYGRQSLRSSIVLINNNCSGSIVATGYVLTAAHCIQDSEKTDKMRERYLLKNKYYKLLKKCGENDEVACLKVWLIDIKAQKISYYNRHVKVSFVELTVSSLFEVVDIDREPTKDMALLKGNTGMYTPLPGISKAPPKIYSPVITIGYPLSLGIMIKAFLIFQGTGGNFHNSEYFLYSGPVAPGASGSPILTPDGKLFSFLIGMYNTNLPVGINSKNVYNFLKANIKIK